MKNHFLLIILALPLMLRGQNCNPHELFKAGQAKFESCLSEHRKQYKFDFLKEDHSPLSAKDTGFIQFFQADLSWLIQAEYEILKDKETEEFATSSGRIKKYTPYALLHFKHGETNFNLTVFQSEQLKQNPAYADYLFLPFTDQTNGDETYGGGRYIDLKTSEFQNGKIWVDFNKAYNPYCAFSGGYSCPVPPKANRLKIKIPAGEMNFTGEKKH